MDCKKQLRRQIQFIETSCTNFEAGNWEEALRIATCLRVIFYDTANCRSILQQMNEKRRINFASSIDNLYEDGFIFWDPMVQRHTNKLGPARDLSPKEFLPIKRWNNQIVLVIGPDKFTRWDMIDFAVHKDGGAHVDDSYEERNNILLEGMWKNEPDHHFIYLYTFGKEVLQSPDLIHLA